MSRILVTGANGFIGTALCDTLMSMRVPFVSSVRRKTSPLHCEIGDLNASTDWTQALLDCDAVIHLAARVHVMNDAADDPMQAYREVNVDATVNLANQAADHGVRRFVFVSSIKVNGEATFDIPFSAGDKPHPIDPYGRSKLEAEQALLEVSRHTGMEVAIVRPTLVYGPGVGANFLRLMRLVKRGLPLPLGRVTNRRSMVAIDNLVDLLIQCTFHPQAAGQTFLASDDNDMSISDLVMEIGRAMNKKPMLLPAPVGLVNACAYAIGKADVASRLFGSLQVDISRTKELLGWRPVVSTDEAIDRTVSHFLKHLQ